MNYPPISHFPIDKAILWYVLFHTPHSKSCFPNYIPGLRWSLPSCSLHLQSFNLHIGVIAAFDGLLCLKHKILTKFHYLVFGFPTVISQQHSTKKMTNTTNHGHSQKGTTNGPINTHSSAVGVGWIHININYLAVNWYTSSLPIELLLGLFDSWIRKQAHGSAW